VSHVVGAKETCVLGGAFDPYYCSSKRAIRCFLSFEDLGLTLVKASHAD